MGEGFPASTRENINTFHVAFSPGGRAWAVVGSMLYVGEELGRRWRKSWDASEPILMIDMIDSPPR